VISVVTNSAVEPGVRSDVLATEPPVAEVVFDADVAPLRSAES
jgi:hypothetical protein